MLTHLRSHRLGRSMSTVRSETSSTVDPSEISKFIRMSHEWWDYNGSFAPLHRQNPTRIKFIRENVTARLNPNAPPSLPFSGLSILDIGCGGGLLSEPLARLGARVTGLDAAVANVTAAECHRRLDPSLQSLTYEAVTAEAYLQRFDGRPQFDVVCALEVIEHVADTRAFMKTLAALLKPGGLLFVSTLNRTPKSYVLAIIGAEYVLRWIPVGTHDWHRFLTPAEVHEHVRDVGLVTRDTNGMVYDPLRAAWSLSLTDWDVNFITCASKDGANKTL